VTQGFAAGLFTAPAQLPTGTAGSIPFVDVSFFRLFFTAGGERKQQNYCQTKQNISLFHINTS
jgi:hypothetical protein